MYRTDVSGAPIDASAVRSVARADVAELHAEVSPAVAEEPEHHLVNVAAKRALTVTEFKQMFYARGDDKFSLANVYECNNLSSNILASVWGKRVSYTRQGPGTATVHNLTVSATTAAAAAQMTITITADPDANDEAGAVAAGPFSITSAADGTTMWYKFHASANGGQSGVDAVNAREIAFVGGGPASDVASNMTSMIGALQSNLTITTSGSGAGVNAVMTITQQAIFATTPTDTISTVLTTAVPTSPNIVASAWTLSSNIANESLVIYDAFGKGVRFEWQTSGTNAELLDAARFTDNGYQPAKFRVVQAISSLATATNLVNAINRAGGYHGAVGAFPGSHPYAQADMVGVGTWVYKAAVGAAAAATPVTVTSRVNSSNAAQRVDISDQTNVGPLGTVGEQQSVVGVLAGTHAGQPGVTVYGRQVTPYNDSRVMNYNKLGGRPDDPSGVDLAYGYATDLQRNFYAQFEVMGNLERDLCVQRDCWTVCSRMSIEDQLYGLAFVAETCDDTCMSVTCSRKWSEVEDALAESCLAENNTIGWGDYVDLYINVRVTNANPKTLDTIIRIRFPVQITRGPDDLGNWNVVASDAADAVITTGVGYDAPEGGNLQYRNAAQTEIHPDYMNQQQTQRWDSTRVHNTNQKVDPHDVVGNP